MYKMLLVEDEPMCSSEINKLFGNFCTLHTTSSPSIALNLAATNKYHLIMIDIKMHSGTAGINIANSIRNLSNYNSIPIVAYAILKPEADKDYLLSCGFTHIISEPFNNRNFVQHIKFILTSQEKNNIMPLGNIKKILTPRLVY